MTERKKSNVEIVLVMKSTDIDILMTEGNIWDASHATIDIGIEGFNKLMNQMIMVQKLLQQLRPAS